MHKRTTHLSTRAIPQSPHKVCLLLFYKCYSKKKKLIIFVKEKKLTRLQSPFVLLFLVQIYFSTSYLPFILTIKLFMVGSTSFLLQLHKYISL